MWEFFFVGLVFGLKTHQLRQHKVFEYLYSVFIFQKYKLFTSTDIFIEYYVSQNVSNLNMYYTFFSQSYRNCKLEILHSLIINNSEHKQVTDMHVSSFNYIIYLVIYNQNINLNVIGTFVKIKYNSKWIQILVFFFLTKLDILFNLTWLYTTTSIVKLDIYYLYTYWHYT